MSRWFDGNEHWRVWLTMLMSDLAASDRLQTTSDKFGPQTLYGRVMAKLEKEGSTWLGLGIKKETHEWLYKELALGLANHQIQIQNLTLEVLAERLQRLELADRLKGCEEALRKLQTGDLNKTNQLQLAAMKYKVTSGLHVKSGPAANWSSLSCLLLVQPRLATVAACLPYGCSLW